MSSTMLLNTFARQAMRTGLKRAAFQRTMNTFEYAAVEPAVEVNSPPTLIWVGYVAFMGTVASTTALCQSSTATTTTTATESSTTTTTTAATTAATRTQPMQRRKPYFHVIKLRSKQRN